LVISIYLFTRDHAGFRVLPADTLTPPVRINTGSLFGSYTDSLGNKWRPDVGFSESFNANYTRQVTVDDNLAVSGTKAPGLFRSMRNAPAAYYLPVADGACTVNLYFAEIDKSVNAAGRQ